MLFNVVVFLALLALVFYLSKQNSISNDTFSVQNVLIFGLSNSSKTKLFYRITEGVTPLTTTSFAVNRKNLKVRETDLEVIDIPGHASFQYEVMKNLQNRSLLMLMVNTTNKFTKKKFY